MSDMFSFNREFDYVRWEGLHQATGRPAHEWDIYIVKELIDNALDADESLWRSAPDLSPSLTIRMDYINLPSPPRQQLLVSVNNRAPFPVEQIPAIFSTRRYTSRKAFVKGITRGSLGNALKTLLGIPYALHGHSAEGEPQLKPLSIRCGTTEYLPRYLSNPTTQELSFACRTQPCRPTSGTTIAVNVDYFVQDVPRTLADLITLAQQYHLCNPHATFHWLVDLADQDWECTYPAQIGWTNTFRGIAPVQWYSLNEFRDLAGALYRQHSAGTPEYRLPLEKLCHYFPGFSEPSTTDSPLSQIIQETGQATLSAEEINGPLSKEVYTAIARYSPPFQSEALGSIGQDEVEARLRASLPLNGRVHYLLATDEEHDASLPFVLEIAVAALQEGKREVWTALNFSPTYGDPFLSSWLHAPIRPAEALLGLRGLLDAYTIREETPFVLFVHLICPHIDHKEFSKTEINHMPFRRVLGRTLDRVLRDLQQGQVEESLRLEQAIFSTLSAILGTLRRDERLIPEQLLETLRQRLSQDPSIAAWLANPDTLARLSAYLSSYQSQNPEFRAFIAPPAEAMVSLPLHPRHYFSIPLEQLSQTPIADRHACNKILYVHARELEPVILANNWLCRLDMALLQVPTTLSAEEALLHCAAQSDLPLLILHDGDEAGYALAERVRAALSSTEEPCVLDLHICAGKHTTGQPTKMLPRDLELWLRQRFDAHGLALKHTPPQAAIRQDIHQRFAHLLREYVLEDIEQQVSLTKLLFEFDRVCTYSQQMMQAQLDEQILLRLREDMTAQSYTTVLYETVDTFFAQFIASHREAIRSTRQAWLRERPW